jgi:hypothetical protein
MEISERWLGKATDFADNCQIKRFNREIVTGHQRLYTKSNDLAFVSVTPGFSTVTGTTTNQVTISMV